MSLTDAVAKCLLERFECQKLVQVLTEVPRFDHSGENIHQQAEIDETSIETHIGNIADPDLIRMRDLNVFEQVAPRFIPLKRSCCSTRTLDADQEMILFHQSSDTSGPNAVSLTHEELGDTPISVSRIRSRKFFYFSSQNRFGRIRFGLTIETAAVETECFTNISHGMLLLQCQNVASLLR